MEQNTGLGLHAIFSGEHQDGQMCIRDRDTGGSLPAGTGRKGAEMGCKVKNKGRRTIITKNGGNFMEKYIFDEGNGLWYELQRD